MISENAHQYPGNLRNSSNRFHKRNIKSLKNTLDSDGTDSRCRICDSKFHCPNKWPDKYYFRLHDTRETIFFEEATDSLLDQTLNTAIADWGCTKIVCHEVWLQYYIGSLSESDKDKINIDRSNNSLNLVTAKL